MRVKKYHETNRKIHAPAKITAKPQKILIPCMACKMDPAMNETTTDIMPSVLFLQPKYSPLLFSATKSDMRLPHAGITKAPKEEKSVTKIIKAIGEDLPMRAISVIGKSMAACQKTNRGINFRRAPLRSAKSTLL